MTLRIRTLVVAVAGALAMFGCASLERAAPVAAQKVRPVQTVRHGMSAAEIYRVGRALQEQGRADEAVVAFRQVLMADPFHADAHNALGVIYSLQGEAAAAEEEFRAAIALAPEAAYLQANLAHHLATHGQPAQALAADARAAALEPTPRERLSAAELQAELLEQVQGLSQRAPPPELAVAPVVVSPIDAVVEAPVYEARLERIADAVFVLRSEPPGRARHAGPISTPVKLQAVAVRSQAQSPVVWIANGNGATGLARRVSQLLAPQGADNARLTNHKPYGVATSVIEHVAGAERKAEEINAGLPVRLPLAQVAALERSAQVRVLLGKDFPREVALTAQAQGAVRVAAR